MLTNIKINLINLKGDQYVILDNIRFDNCSYIQLIINGEDVRGLLDFDDMLIVYSELMRSRKFDGDYLIFTCACGVADDGGWNLVKVKHKEDLITWEFEHGINYFFEFNKDNYFAEIDKIDLIIKENPSLNLIPEFFIYPE